MLTSLIAHLAGLSHAVLSALPAAIPTIAASLAALLYQVKRGRRDTQFRLMQQIDGQFNAPTMREYRKRAARKMLELPLSLRLGKPTQPIRRVIDFFACVARDCRSGQLLINDIERAYQQHIQILCSSYPRYITGRVQSKKHADLLWLVNHWGAYESLAAGISTVQRAFLEAEASL